MIGYCRLAWRLPRLLLWVLVGLLLACWVSLRSMTLPASLAHRQKLTQFWLRGLCACLPYRVQRLGELPQQGALWLANHISWLDIAVLGSITPLSFLSKAEVRRWPIAGWLAAQAGTLFIQRGSGDGQQLSLQIAERLELGLPTLIFPEGTTTDGASVRTFHARLLASALERNALIQPLALRYRRQQQRDTLAPFIGDDDLLSHLWRLLQAPVADVEVHLLPCRQTCSTDSRRALAASLQQQVTQRVHGHSTATTADAAGTPDVGIAHTM